MKKVLHWLDENLEEFLLVVFLIAMTLIMGIQPEQGQPKPDELPTAFIAVLQDDNLPGVSDVVKDMTK